MAVPLTKQQVYQLPIQSSIQPKTGDIAFCCGHRFTSKIVQYLTKSCWSHCALIWQTQQGTFLLEADVHIGVRLIPFSRCIQPAQGFLYEGPIVLGRYTGIESDLLNSMLSWGLEQISESYDFLDYVSLWIRGLCGVYSIPPYRGERCSFSKWLCSEFVGACFKNIGHPLRKESFISPSQVWEHGDIEMVGRVA